MAHVTARSSARVLCGAYLVNMPDDRHFYMSISPATIDDCRLGRTKPKFRRRRGHRFHDRALGHISMGSVNRAGQRLRHRLTSQDSASSTSAA